MPGSVRWSLGIVRVCLFPAIAIRHSSGQITSEEADAACHHGGTLFNPSSMVEGIFIKALRLLPKISLHHLQLLSFTSPALLVSISLHSLHISCGSQTGRGIKALGSRASETGLQKLFKARTRGLNSINLPFKQLDVAYECAGCRKSESNGLRVTSWFRRQVRYPATSLSPY